MGLSGPVTHPAGTRNSVFSYRRGLRLRLLFVLVDKIHQRLIDLLELSVVLNGLEIFLAVFLHGFQNADLKIFILVVLTASGGDQRQIPAAVVLQLGQDLKLVFLAVFVGDADEIVAVLLSMGFLRITCLMALFYPVWPLKSRGNC